LYIYTGKKERCFSIVTGKVSTRIDKIKTTVQTGYKMNCYYLGLDSSTQSLSAILIDAESGHCTLIQKQEVSFYIFGIRILLVPSANLLKYKNNLICLKAPTKGYQYEFTALHIQTAFSR